MCNRSEFELFERCRYLCAADGVEYQAASISNESMRQVILRNMLWNILVKILRNIEVLLIPIVQCLWGTFSTWKNQMPKGRPGFGEISILAVLATCKECVVS